MTVKEALENCVKTLAGIYDVGEAEAIADWLMEHIIGEKIQSRPQISKRELNAEQDSKLKESLSRLETGEPLQYVINESWFCGLKFFVTPAVLIPRPETEELVEWIISDCKFPINELSILDLGTGSGCISIALKRRLGKADIYAIDINDDALEIAQKNANDIGVEVAFSRSSILDNSSWEGLPNVDVIVSNPPYIPSSDKSSLARNVVDYEPTIALFVPDNDPLIFYKAIAGIAEEKLNQGGSVYLEIHAPFADQLIEFYLSKGFKPETKEDMQGLKRMMKLSRIN